MWVYSRYITKNGVRIYRKDGKVFRFWVDDDKALKTPLPIGRRITKNGTCQLSLKSYQP